MFDAYLAIETTGCISSCDKILVLGLCLDNGHQRTIVQLTGEDLTKESLIATLSGVQNLFTYNGNRFDLPFIQEILKINIEAIVPNHHDLIYDCWRCNLYGGLKETEKQLNIHRNHPSVCPVGMVNLLRKYREKGDRKVIAALLEYNRKTMINLKIVRERMPWLALVQKCEKKWPGQFLETGRY